MPKVGSFRGSSKPFRVGAQGQIGHSAEVSGPARFRPSAKPAKHSGGQDHHGQSHKSKSMKP